MITVGLIEDHQGQRQSLSELLNRSEGIRCIGAFGSAEKGVVELLALRPEIVLVDIHLPGKNGVFAVSKMKPFLPKTHFLMRTIDGDPEMIFAALQAGAIGYLLKRDSPSDTIAAVRSASDGGAPMSARVARIVVGQFHRQPVSEARLEDLTPREMEVLQSLASGNRYSEIAEELDIGLGTVQSHVRNIYKKLQVHSAVEATRLLR